MNSFVASHSRKYNIIHNIIYEWYQECCSSDFYIIGLFPQEIKNQLKKSKLDGFAASYVWILKWKATYAMKEWRIIGVDEGSSKGIILL